jgi:hypothetical protein
MLGDHGDKLVKRVLGHADGSVTAIYNRYAYVREMRHALEVWADDLTARPTPLQRPSAPTIFRKLHRPAIPECQMGGI